MNCYVCDTVDLGRSRSVLGTREEHLQCGVGHRMHTVPLGMDGGRNLCCGGLGNRKVAPPTVDQPAEHIPSPLRRL